MEEPGLYDLINRYFPFMVAWLLLSVRFFGLALIFPLFSWVNLTTTVRAAFAAAMAAPLALLEFANRSFVMSLTAADILILTTKELFIGVLIGLIAGVPFWAAQSCGELIDTYRGSSAGNLFDPSLTTETSELGAGLVIVALGVLVWSGGFAQLIGGVYLTFTMWPVEKMLPGLELASAQSAAASIGLGLSIAIGMAGTLLLCMFSVDLALALFSRSTRQFQVFDISLTVKNLALVLLLPIVGGALVVLITREVARGTFSLDQLRLLLP